MSTTTCTSDSESPNLPPSPGGSSSSSRSPSFSFSLAWDVDDKMSHVTPPPPKIRRSFSDRLFRRTSDGLSQPDTKLGLKTFYEPPSADVE